MTNAVKHFKWTPRGKRRLHQTPDRTEVEACRPWLEQELTLVKPRLLVLLGATAVKSQLGSKVRVTQVRGRPVESDLADFVVPTVHPSSILRVPPERRREAEGAFIADLRAAASLL